MLLFSFFKIFLIPKRRKKRGKTCYDNEKNIYIYIYKKKLSSAQASQKQKQRPKKFKKGEKNSHLKNLGRKTKREIEKNGKSSIDINKIKNGKNKLLFKIFNEL